MPKVFIYIFSPICSPWGGKTGKSIFLSFYKGGCPSLKKSMYIYIYFFVNKYKYMIYKDFSLVRGV
jgi:hypothetical protein